MFWPCPLRLQSVPSSVCPDFCPMLSVFHSLRKNTERISGKFTGGHHYHEQIKIMITFWANWNRDKGAQDIDT